MSIEGLRLMPSAPDALKRAIVDSEKTYDRHHTETVNNVNALITPLLQALSIPEVYSQSSTKIDGVPQEDLWRRSLSYPLEVTAPERPGYSYYIYATQMIDSKGDIRRTMLGAIEAAPDEIPIASMGPEKLRFGNLTVRNARRELAVKAELSEIEDLAKLLAEETPRQAVEKGRISLHWMERWDAKDPAKLPCKEGFPPNPKDKLYEVVLWNGVRNVCKVILGDEEHGFRDQRGKPLWMEDLYAGALREEASVAAWRELGSIIPEYHRREKYPNLYRVSI